MNPPTRAQVLAQLRLTIRLLEAEEAAREAELDYADGMRELEPEYPPPKVETLDRVVMLRTALALNRAELALLEAEGGLP